MAGSREKVELMLEARYPTLPGCTLIDRYKGSLHNRIRRKADENEWSYRRRCRDEGYSQYTKYDGWVTLSTPRLKAKDLDRDDLRDKLVQHKVLLLSPGDFEQLGGKEKLMATGISPVPGGFGNIKVRWNPKAVKLREWRKKVQEIQKLHITSFEGGVLTTIANCVAPRNWQAPCRLQVSSTTPVVVGTRTHLPVH